MKPLPAPRIGWITLGHKDYPNAVGEGMARQAIAGLRDAGLELEVQMTTVTGPRQAGETARALLREDVDGVILFLGTWLECPVAMAAIREVEHLPFALWGFPMHAGPVFPRDSTGSLVAYTVLKGALDRLGRPWVGILAETSGPGGVQQAVAFARGARAAARLKRARLGLIGYASMGMYAGTFDHLLLRGVIGPEVDHLDTYTLVRRAEAVSDEACQEELSRLRSRVVLPVSATGEELTMVGRLTAALHQLAHEHEWDALTLKCQYELSVEYRMAGCLPLSLVAEDGIPCGCEGDVLCAVTMLMLHYLGGGVIAYGDVMDFRGRQIYLSPCGYAPFALAREDQPIRVSKFDEPGIEGLFDTFVLKPGPATLARLTEGRGDYRLIAAAGQGVESELRQGLYPALEFELAGDIERFKASMPSQHYAFAYGDWSTELALLSRLLGIEFLLH